MSLTGVVVNTFSSRSDSTGGLSSSLPPATAPTHVVTPTWLNTQLLQGILLRSFCTTQPSLLLFHLQHLQLEPPLQPVLSFSFSVGGKYVKYVTDATLTLNPDSKWTGVAHRCSGNWQHLFIKIWGLYWRSEIKSPSCYCTVTLLSLTYRLSVTLGTVAGQKARVPGECQWRLEDKALHQWKHFQRLPLQHDGGLIRGVCRTRLAVFYQSLLSTATERRGTRRSTPTFL